jgi:hypothetical protein
VRTAMLTLSTAVLTLSGVAIAHHAAADTVNRIDATETVTSWVQGDLGHKGLDEGDPIAYTSRMTDRHGKQIGRASGHCTVIRASGKGIAEAVCTGVYRLPGGELTTVGTYSAIDKGPQSEAIVGGTGRYAGVGGSLDYTNASADSLTETFRLRH